MTAQIRPAKPGEEAAVVPLYEWLFEPPGSPVPGWDPARAAVSIREAIDSDEAAVILAEADGRLVGLCTAYLELNSVRFGQRCWVEDLAVDPGRRSQGIGGRLLDEAATWAAGRGATHLELDTAEARTDAQRFYERRRPAWRSVSYAFLLEPASG
jgi:GNAT superfamily N-acetyltransferase